MRVIGMDIHRSFAQVAVLENGEVTRQLRVDLLHTRVTEFAQTLSREDDVVLAQRRLPEGVRVEVVHDLVVDPQPHPLAATDREPPGAGVQREAPAPRRTEPVTGVGAPVVVRPRRTVGVEVDRRLAGRRRERLGRQLYGGVRLEPRVRALLDRDVEG